VRVNPLTLDIQCGRDRLRNEQARGLPDQLGDTTGDRLDVVSLDRHAALHVPRGR
jgi:hypothetical protein